MSKHDEASMEELWQSSQISGGSAAYLDDIYEQYLEDPNSIDEGWKNYFDSIRGSEHEVSHAQVRQDFIELAKHPRVARMAAAADMGGNFPDGGNKVSAVMDLVYAYRYVGHKMAKIDPLGLIHTEKATELEPEFHGLQSSDQNESFNVGVFSENKPAKLKDIISKLQSVYCASIGVEYMHLTDMAEKMWIRERFESKNKPVPSVQKRWLLDRLSAAESLEKYLGMKYVGQKRFSVEGAESLIVSLNGIIEKSGGYKVKEIIIGMAHRGRLNVLVNIMGKSPESLFREFEGSQDKLLLSGDVKYHMGFSSYHKTTTDDVHLSLAFNPSHLETVDAVIEGSARARQDRRGEQGYQQVLPIQIHGDSAFCGQGIVMETLALSQTRYYGTGGTLHIVINNQVGFTTNKREDNRSSLYCTDIAKMIECPIFHVNADDPEAVLRVTEIAMDYRMTFNKDVVIDLVCYRRHGHQEVDEPTGTQPMMYSIIKKLATTRGIYADKLVAEQVITAADAKGILGMYREKLDKGEVVAGISDTEHPRQDKLLMDWSPYFGHLWDEKVSTKYNKKKLIALAHRLGELPEGLTLQPQVRKAYDDRKKMADGEIEGNWGFAELLAYATLLEEGYNLRLSGEDTGRGTFSHRHAVLHNYDVTNTELRETIPLQHINENAQCHIIDSVLSEYGVLGFEYGYSCSAPESLVIWEAQFGDFANTAQVVIDQFIASAEEKWGRLCGLVMYLPHGQEGAGAEHSSARLERYLQLCANDNMQVCNVTTPAQLFHMIRRQMVRPLRKPLIVMSPKSLLRHPMVHSTIDELASGQFYNVLPEPASEKIDAKKVTRVLLCSGKVYYDLLTRRHEKNIKDIAIIRLEQLYPFPVKDIKAILKPYAHVSDIVWTQEEPENQGAWRMIQHEIRKILVKDQTLSYAGRKASSAPAVGYPSLFHAQQAELVNDALKLSKK